MISIYDTLSKIRKRNGEFLFTDKSYNLYELINKLLMKDSRIGYGKTIKILKSLGMSNLDEMSFRDILKDLNFLQLDERKFIINYDKSLIGYKIYVPVSFSYIGIQTLLQYFNKNNMISFTDGNIVNFKEVSNEYDEDLEDE